MLSCLLFCKQHCLQRNPCRKRMQQRKGKIIPRTVVSTFYNTPVGRISNFCMLLSLTVEYVWLTQVKRERSRIRSNAIFACTRVYDLPLYNRCTCRGRVDRKPLPSEDYVMHKTANNGLRCKIFSAHIIQIHSRIKISLVA